MSRWKDHRGSQSLNTHLKQPSCRLTGINVITLWLFYPSLIAFKFMPIPCQTENNCCKVKSANYCHWTFRYYFTSIYFPIDHNDTCNYLARNRNRNIESIVRSNVKRIIVEYNIQREEFNFTLILQIFRETNKSSNFNLNTCGAYESQRFFFISEQQDGTRRDILYRFELRLI